jgi:hypothetical protein
MLQAAVKMTTALVSIDLRIYNFRIYFQSALPLAQLDEDVYANLNLVGEILFNNDERLAKCVDAVYKRTAKFAVKANTKLDLLKVEKQHYFRLRICVDFFLGSRTINNSDKEFNKKVAELQTSLKEGQKKADEAFEDEEAKEAKAE